MHEPGVSKHPLNRRRPEGFRKSQAFLDLQTPTSTQFSPIVHSCWPWVGFNANFTCLTVETQRQLLNVFCRITLLYTVLKRFASVFARKTWVSDASMLLASAVSTLFCYIGHEEAPQRHAFHDTFWMKSMLRKLRLKLRGPTARCARLRTLPCSSAVQPHDGC